MEHHSKLKQSRPWRRRRRRRRRKEEEGP